LSNLTKIRVGGVPEHFNLPWHLAIENGLFEKEGIEVEWTVFKGGTGQMTRALRKNEIDVCILLTEGIIADIVNGNPAKLIGKYLNTPLIWGVYTGIHNSVTQYGEIYDKQYAVSRFGSGSHLMPIVDANSKKIKLKHSQFEVIKNLDGALESLATNATDAFYWEKYTTKPYVDSGLLKHLGDYVTPWPCFMMAATNSVLERAHKSIERLKRVIYFTTKQFMTSPTAIKEVSERYHQKIEDVEAWFHATEWSTNDDISDKLLENVLHTLKVAEIIEYKPALSSFRA